MPELPEVQTTVNGLNQKVLGKTIASTWTDWPQLIRGHTTATFAKQLKGAKILCARRRGKNIFIDLDTKDSMHVHMKMTGHLLFGKWILQRSSLRVRMRVSAASASSERDGARLDRKIFQEKNTFGTAKQSRPGLLRPVLTELAKTTDKKTWIAKEPGPLRDDPGNRFIRLMITFTDGTQLALCDMRRFAKVGLYPTNSIEVTVGPLGPEPLDNSFTKEDLAQILKHTTIRPIKQFLMDQTKIAGIGNIYSDEMLFRASIHPRRRPSSLGKKEITLLHTAMREVLREGMNFGGDSDVDYRNINGERGRFQGEHKAYRRTGKHCTKRGCVGVIKREIIGGRSGHYCSEHQRLQ